MLDALKKLFADDTEKSQISESDYRVAAAALLLHAAAIDGSLSEKERARLRALVKERFQLDDAGTDELLDAATVAERQAIDLYRFTERLNRVLDAPGRARMVEMMWQVVFADGAITEFEDNLIWRAADLLHVSREERIALRERVAGAR